MARIRFILAMACCLIGSVKGELGSYPCVSSCAGVPDGDYQSCQGCDVYASCSGEYLFDNRPCAPADPPLAWDDKTKRCEHASTTCAPGNRTRPVECVSSCFGRPDGDYQSCLGCDVYVSCWAGQITDNRPCPAGLIWDDNKKACDYSSETCFPEVHQACPENLPFTTVMEKHDDICYQFVDKEMNWIAGLDYCRKYNGSLVSINGAETNSFLVSTLNRLQAERKWNNNGVWIGLNDRQRELHWQWTTSDPNFSTPLIWSNWDDGFPGETFHRLRNCVRMNKGRKTDWKWRETFCKPLFTKYRFICEYQPK